MKNHNSFGIYLAGILILLMLTVSIASAQYEGGIPTLGTTAPTPTLTLGTTPPTTVAATIGGNGIPLNPVISVVALSCIGLLIILKKRK
jgi:hypothetical protein